MSKTNLLIISVVALFVLNIGTITALIWGRPSPPPPMHFQHDHKNRTKNIVIKKLQFSPAQTSAYEKLIDKHRRAILSATTEIKTAKHMLYKQLQKEEPNREQPFIQKIGTLQMKMEKIHFNHFEQVKQLCTDEQLIHFNQLSEELANLLAPPRQRPKR